MSSPSHGRHPISLLPTFFLIGAAKSATTSLWSMLAEHPDVFFPEMKEPDYLRDSRTLRRGLSWYESLYAPAGQARHRGDNSNSYSMFPLFVGVPQRAAALVPDARIIYIIRHPVKRMVSHWVQTTTAGYEHRKLEHALVWGSPYYFSSCYGLQISRWSEAFPREALLVVRSEDLATDPGVTIDRILRHLGLAPGWRPNNAQRWENASSYKPRTARPLIRVSGALRGVGLEGPAQRVARRTPFKKRARLLRPYRDGELDLDPARSEALFECFRSDFALLRQFVGDEMDLYGLA